MKVEGDQANVKNKDVTPIFHNVLRSCNSMSN